MEQIQTDGPRIACLEKQPHFTSDGLVVKGMEIIKTLRTNYLVREQHVFMSWQCSRIVRRDFHITTAKMYKYGKSGPGRRHQIEQMLLDITDEADAIENMARKYEMPSPISAAPIELTIVSEQAHALCVVLVTVDRALSKLLCSEMAQVADDNCAAFYRSIDRLKRIVFSRWAEKSQQT